jgi:glycosyltransferase involved in cell wall biosynthesis
MRILIFEPLAGGHHTNYIEALLESLVRLRRKGNISEVIVAVTSAHRSSLSFQRQIARFEPDVVFDATLPAIDPTLPLADRLRDARHFRAVVLKHTPDLAISTTADQQTLAAALLSLVGVPVIPSGPRTIGLIHSGYAGRARNTADRAKDVLYGLGLKNAPWTRIGIINPLVYEWAIKRMPSSAGRFVLVPDPVPPVKTLPRAEARRALCLPETGTYIGHVGSTDHRKAIPELLSAFKAVARPDERLLLAGSLAESHRRLLTGEYAELVRSGAIVLRDRYIESSEIAAALSAIDAAAPLHYPRTELSANMLKAVAAGRPVLADSYGYTGEMIERSPSATPAKSATPRPLKVPCAELSTPRPPTGQPRKARASSTSTPPVISSPPS